MYKFLIFAFTLVIACAAAMGQGDSPRHAKLGITQNSPANRRIKGLQASGPSREFAEKMMLFGQFVGDWEFDLTQINPDGTKRTGKGEWHFGWVLDGRAIQDVWIARFNGTKADALPEGHGTTIRMYDSAIDAWRIVWVSVARKNLQIFTARNIGEEIVLEATAPEDSQERGRWIFSEITKNSFRWRAVESEDGGKTWRTIQEMQVRRSGSGNDNRR